MHGDLLYQAEKVFSSAAFPSGWKPRLISRQLRHEWKLVPFPNWREIGVFSAACYGCRTRFGSYSKLTRPSAVVELQLQPPEHFKTQETRNLGAGKSAHGGRSKVMILDSLVEGARNSKSPCRSCRPGSPRRQSTNSIAEIGTHLGG